MRAKNKNSKMSVKNEKGKKQRLAEPERPAPPSTATLPDAEQTIPKPAGKFSLDKFKSTRAATVAGLVTLQTALPVHSLAQAKDFVRLHPTELSDELFVSVPIKGAPRDTIHLIGEKLATRYLPSKKIIRHQLALASKPMDHFFLCIVPSINLDNPWVSSNLAACEQAKTLWTQATSRRDEGIEGYNVTLATDPDAFPEPAWPMQSLDELIMISFTGRMIETDDHPGLLRLLGVKPK
jgi:hypothetical protein